MRALILVLGCASSAPTQMMMSSDDLSGAPSASDMAMTNGMSDKQLCDSACTTLISCGVEFGSGCSGGCQVSNVFLPCIKMTDVSDCNAVSLCSFKQYSTDVCSGTGGVPSGSASCNDTASCEGNCNINQPGVASCPCNCIAGLLPIKASALLINNQCALSKCATECGVSGSGAACNTCAAQKCVAEHTQCANQ